uniref:Uncharacterized protein n=1 Tax=Anguilla anguilla TaxID=7936 RepID=A0A0E9X080_ANGAN
MCYYTHQVVSLFASLIAASLKRQACLTLRLACCVQVWEKTSERTLCVQQKHCFFILGFRFCMAIFSTFP